MKHQPGFQKDETVFLFVFLGLNILKKECMLIIYNKGSY